MAERILLAGDIGGTKTDLAIFSTASGPRAPRAEAAFPSGRYPSLVAIAQEFLAQIDTDVDAACFGVAGPVVDGEATITNLPWMMGEAQLGAALGISSVRLLNDLLSIAHAVPVLESEDVHTLNPGKVVYGGAIAVVAPGTGLGEAFLAWDGARYRAYASEGGHADFAPNSARELELLRYLQERLGHVSCERVCSGRGIPNIYAYLGESGYADESPGLREQLGAAEDPTPLIVQAALDAESPCERCVATLDMFVSILGAEAGNLALKVLATGGVYLGGGIPPRILPALESERFTQAFRHKGRMSGVLSDMPVHVILNSRAALLGAASYGLDLLSV